MIKHCGGSKSTLRRSLDSLAKRGLVIKQGKPFGGSCRYLVNDSIVPPENGLAASNSSISGTIEELPIVPPETLNSPSGGTPIVPPEVQEGSPRKEIQERNSKREVSSAGIDFANWFQSTLDESTNLSKNWRSTFAKIFDDLVKLDHRTPEQVRAVSTWAREDSFWRTNFMSPAKLRKRNGDGVQFFDVFAAKMKQSTLSPSQPRALNIGRRSGHSNSYNESTDID